MKSVLVTTIHKGVFFGDLDDDTDQSERTLTLTDCRNVIYWESTKGFLALAKHGPEEGSRIGATAPSLMIHDITSVATCTDEAIKAFRGWSDELGSA